MKLVVGLGNPGRKYEGTRHNVGFDVLAEVAEKLNASSARQKFDGELAEANYQGERVYLLCPLTFMNLSGKSVQQARDFYSLENRDVLIMCDDFQLPLARLRFRPGGSAGGQKGLDDVIRRCGSDVPRLRIGIGPVPEHWDVAKFVLARFTPDERQAIDAAVKRAADGVLDWISLGIESCMNRYNAAEPRSDESSGKANEKH